MKTADAEAESNARDDIKLVSGSQLRPYDSIEGTTPVPEGPNGNYIVDHLNKVGIVCTTSGNASTNAIVCHGRQKGKDISRYLYERGEATGG